MRLSRSAWPWGVTVLAACTAPAVGPHPIEPAVMPSPTVPAPHSPEPAARAPAPEPTPAPVAPTRARVFELLGAGTSWETEAFLLVGSEPGPMVVVVAGVHGDEPAGPVAAEALLYWGLTRGRMYVIPRANVRALARGSRRTPVGRHRDLNRNFPLDEDDPPRGAVAASIWDLTARVTPDVLIDLHEGFDFNRTNPKSVGSCVLFNPWDGAHEQAERLVDTVNATIEKPWRHFTTLRTTAPGSLARAATRVFGTHAFIFETTKTASEPVSSRAAQHVLLVERLLLDLDMGPVPGPPPSEGMAKPDDVR